MLIRLPRDPEFYAKNLTRVVMLAAGLALPFVNGTIDKLADGQAKQTAVLEAIQAKLTEQDKKIALIEQSSASDRDTIKGKFDSLRADMSSLRDKMVDFIRRSETGTAQPPPVVSGHL